jgi:hypothetical protein
VLFRSQVELDFQWTAQCYIPGDRTLQGEGRLKEIEGASKVEIIYISVYLYEKSNKAPLANIEIMLAFKRKQFLN